MDYLETQKAPYLFNSDSLFKILDTTTSIRTKLAIIDMIGPRLTDPKAKMDQFLDLFRFSDEKAHVEEVLKARAAILTSSMFKNTNNSAGGKTMGGRGGGRGRGSSALFNRSPSTAGAAPELPSRVNADDDFDVSHLNSTHVVAQEYDFEPVVPEKEEELEKEMMRLSDSARSGMKFSEQPPSPPAPAPVPVSAPAPPPVRPVVVAPPPNTAPSSAPLSPPKAPVPIIQSANRVPETVKQAAAAQAPPDSRPRADSASRPPPPVPPVGLSKTTKMSTALDNMAKALTALKDTADQSPRAGPESAAPSPKESFRMTPVCPGLVVKIRPQANAEVAHTGIIKHGEEIEVYKQRVNGYYELVNGKGFINKNTVGVTWMIPSEDRQVTQAAQEAAANTFFGNSRFSLSRFRQLDLTPKRHGVLLKLSDWLREWRPRYFALYGSKLFMCSDPNPSDSEEPKVEVDFSNAGPNFSMLLAEVKDRKYGVVLELKLQKLKDRPKGFTLRSAFGDYNEAHNDLQQWINAIAEITQVAPKSAVEAQRPADDARERSSSSVGSETESTVISSNVLLAWGQKKK